MEAPERIYLQGLRGDDGEWYDWHTCMGDEVSWCERRINDYDVEYVRRDVAMKLRQALEHCMANGTGWNYAVEIKAARALDETAWLADSPNAENGESE